MKDLFLVIQVGACKKQESCCCLVFCVLEEPGGLFPWLLQCCQKYISSRAEISMSMWPILPSQFYFSPLNKCIRFKVTFPFYKALKDILWYTSGLRQQLSTRVQRIWLSKHKSQEMRQHFPGHWSRITSDLITLCARKRNLRPAFMYKSSWTWLWMNTYITFIAKSRMGTVNNRCCGLWILGVFLIVCFVLFVFCFFSLVSYDLKEWHKNDIKTWMVLHSQAFC